MKHLPETQTNFVLWWERTKPMLDMGMGDECDNTVVTLKILATSVEDNTITVDTSVQYTFQLGMVNQVCLCPFTYLHPPPFTTLPPGHGLSL